MRIFFLIISLVLFFSAPYWAYIPFMLVGIILFPLYLEAVVFGLLIDTAYGGHVNFLLGLPFGIAAAVLVLLAVPLRESLRFNA